jgi:membrane protease YdiL (CAAX protease family)
MYFILPSLLGFLIPILLIGAVVYLIVRRRNAENGFGVYDAMMCYFYFIIGASVIILTIGIAILLYVALHQAYDGGNMDDTIALGLTLAGTGAIICILHMFGKLALEKKERKSTRTIKRIYLFFMLTIFSISGLVALPVAIYAFAHYYIEGSRHWDDPSAPIATAIVTVPMWIYYLWRVMQETRAKKKEIQ